MARNNIYLLTSLYFPTPCSAGDKNAFNGVINPLSSGLSKGKGGADVIDADIMKTLQGLSEESKNMEGMDPLAAEAMGEVRPRVGTCS
jgi:hypothetical protein